MVEYFGFATGLGREIFPGAVLGFNASFLPFLSSTTSCLFTNERLPCLAWLFKVILLVVLPVPGATEMGLLFVVMTTLYGVRVAEYVGSGSARYLAQASFDTAMPPFLPS